MRAFLLTFAAEATYVKLIQGTTARCLGALEQELWACMQCFDSAAPASHWHFRTHVARYCDQQGPAGGLWNHWRDSDACLRSYLSSDCSGQKPRFTRFPQISLSPSRIKCRGSFLTLVSRDKALQDIGRLAKQDDGVSQGTWA